MRDQLVLTLKFMEIKVQVIISKEHLLEAKELEPQVKEELKLAAMDQSYHQLRSNMELVITSTNKHGQDLPPEIEDLNHLQPT